jgi:biopolymer transport protein ExbD
MTINLSKDGRIFVGLTSQREMAKLFGPENALKASVEVEKEELGEYLINARLTNLRLVTVIKADKDAEFGLAEDVMEILQKARINKFNLVTNLMEGEREAL